MRAHPALSGIGAVADILANLFDKARASSSAAATSSNDAGAIGAGLPFGITGCRIFPLCARCLHLPEQYLAVERLASNALPHISHIFVAIDPPRLLPEGSDYGFIVRFSVLASVF